MLDSTLVVETSLNMQQNEKSHSPELALLEVRLLHLTGSFLKRRISMSFSVTLRVDLEGIIFLLQTFIKLNTPCAKSNI